MRHRGWATWILSLALGLSLAPSAQAQELDDDALEDADDGLEVVPLRRLDVVQNKSFNKEGRFELYPNAYGLITNNHFARRQIALTGLGFAYHVKEQVYFDFTAQFYPFLGTSDLAFNNVKGLTEALAQLGAGNSNSQPVQVSAEKLYLGLSLGFSPVYGKLNLAGEHVQNFDISMVAGVGFLQIEDYYYLGDYDANGVLYLTEVDGTRETRSFPTGHVGVASRYPLAPWFALKGEARLVGYVETVSDYTGDATVDQVTGETIFPTKKAFASAFMVTVGASFFFPN